VKEHWTNGCLAHSRPSCAVNRNGNRETPRVVSVRPGRVDHEVELVGVDLAHFGIGHFGQDEWGVGEVREPAHTPRVAVLHPRHRIRWELRPRDQEWLAQAFDLNARTGRSAMNNLESLVEWVPRPRQCHPCEQLQNRGNCGCFKPGLTRFLHCVTEPDYRVHLCRRRIRHSRDHYAKVATSGAGSKPSDSLTQAEAEFRCGNGWPGRGSKPDGFGPCC